MNQNNAAGDALKHINIFALLALEIVVLGYIFYSTPLAETSVRWGEYMKSVENFRRGVHLPFYEEGTSADPHPPHPGGFALLYSILSLLTRQGAAIAVARGIHAVVYLMNFTAVVLLFKKAGLPLKAFLPMLVSRKLREVFVIAFFSDGWGVLFLHASIVALAVYRRHRLAAFLYAVSLSLHAEALYMAPGLLVVLWKTVSVADWVSCVLVILSTQIAANMPLLVANKDQSLQYLQKVYTLPTTFLKDQAGATSMQFISNQEYTSESFGYGLLMATVVSWVAMAVRHWFRRVYKSTARPTNAEAAVLAEKKQTATLALTLIESNLIGLFFTRSLYWSSASWLYLLPFSMYFTTIPQALRTLTVLGFRFMITETPTTKTSGAVALAFAICLLSMIQKRNDNKVVEEEEEAKNKASQGNSTAQAKKNQ